MTLKPPKALSRKSKAIWAELTELHHFEAHEIVTFERALQWWDVSDASFEGALQSEGKQRAELLKLSLDASNAALRCWRTLKFPRSGRCPTSWPAIWFGLEPDAEGRRDEGGGLKMPSPRASANDLTDQMHHFFQCGMSDGQLAPVRLRGWIDALDLIYGDEAALAALWTEHAEALQAEAKAAGFVPWFIDQAEADDPARAEWSKRFCDANGY